MSRKALITGANISPQCIELTRAVARYHDVFAAFQGNFAGLRKPLSVPIDVHITHPVVFSQLYSSPFAILGQVMRLSVNVLSQVWHRSFRATKADAVVFKAQTIVAMKPGAPA